MEKCDVCEKSTLLPEKFGAINICKVCFMKANGLLWKHQYDRYDEAKKHWHKAIEGARKNDFPEPVITAINDYFIKQIKAMHRCDSCNQPVQHLYEIGNAKICNQCFDKINTSAWKETEYEDNEKVEVNRQKILKIAHKNNFPPIVIEGINIYFDAKIQKGLICHIDGDKGQRLKVYDTHCVLITEDDFDIEEMSKAYGAALKSSQPRESLLTNATAKNLAQNVLTGGILKAGINLATSAVINVAADKFVPEKGMFKIVNGKYKIDYTLYDHVEVHKRNTNNENDIGYIRFVNNKATEKYSEDIVFFFYAYDKKIEIAYNGITNGISLTKQLTTAMSENNAVVQQSFSQQTMLQTSVADELLKFKNLLDMGAITQEEFDAKKKQLLGL